MRWIFIITCTFLFHVVMAQDTARLSIIDVLRLAELNYPKLVSNRYQLEASKANITLQKQSNIPQFDAAYQANMATHNNISGMLLPQYVLPISGPPSASNDYSPITGSAASLLLQWQPGLFGERKSNISLANAATQTKQSQNEQEIFIHKIKTSGEYIDLVYSIQLLKLYEENVRISLGLLQQIKVLAINGLRPGVDTALLQSELSHNRIESLKINTVYVSAIAALQKSLGTDSIILPQSSLKFESTPVLQLPDSMEHPLLKTARLNIEEANTKRTVINKISAPRFSMWGTTYARGSGVDYTGSIKTYDGLSLSRINYGIGVQLSVPLLKQPEVKTKLQQQDWLIKSEQQKSNQINIELKEQRKVAEITFLNAVAISKETPIQLHSADYAFKAMSIRYQDGLVNYSELLQTQSNLLKAKIDVAKSQVELTKALLYKAAVSGDLNLFINQVK